MVTPINCPFCGGKYFLFGKKDTHKSDKSVTCPNYGTVSVLSRLEKYRNLTAQKIVKPEVRA